MPFAALGIGIADLFGGGAVLGEIGTDIASLFGLGEGAAAAAPGIGAAAPAAEAGAATALPGIGGIGGAPTALSLPGATDLTAFTGADFAATGAPGYGAPGAIDSALGLTANPITGGTPVTPSFDFPSSGLPGVSPSDWGVGAPGTSGAVTSSTGGDLAAVTGGSAGGTPPATTQSGNVLQNLINNPIGTLGEGAAQSLTKNPLGIALGGAGLAYGLAANKNNPLNTAEGVTLQQDAARENALGKQLQSYLTSGTLPPALQTQVNQATQSAKNTIIARYAQNGLSTDPKQNSTLAQELAQVDTNAITATSKIAVDLMNTGIQQTNLSDSLYQFMLGVNQNQQQNLAKSIANFATAFGGGIKLNTGTGGTPVTIGA